MRFKIHDDFLSWICWSVVIAVIAGGSSSHAGSGASATQIVYLSGQGPKTTVKWDFFCTQGRNSGFWTNIAVPSQWELQGFGAYDYGHAKEKHAERGLYRRSFRAPEEWRGRRVRLVFDGVMTDTLVKVNGQSAGPVHRGGFYRFRHDITELLKFGANNLLEVEVSKVSADASVEGAERGADYWVFGGIYRPVFLEILPEEFLDRLAINALADGTVQAEVFPARVHSADHIVWHVETTNGQPVSKMFSAEVKPGVDKVLLQSQVQQPKLWSAETPNLYVIRATLLSGATPIHEVTRRFGFRTFEIRAGKGLFLNGRRIILQGFNRHCFRPESGRTLDPAHSLEDVQLLKSLNANAVRCSHYPPDEVFLDYCDELGLYVVDELCTWQKPILDTPVARKLVRELVERDVNHPSILFWANGNEGGFNFDVDDDYALHDPQHRAVLHPWSDFRGIFAAHYRTYEEHVKALQGPSLYLTTEFLHGLYDGGHGAGLADYWQALRASPFGGGGFLWVLADEGVVRTDRSGSIDTSGNNAPDGVVGPRHEHEGSFDSVRAIWSPVQIPLERLPADFQGQLPLENTWSFRSLTEVEFEWALLDFSAPGDTPQTRVLHSGKLTGPAVGPGAMGNLELPLPQDWREARALRLVAKDSNQRELMTRVWPLASCAEMLASVWKNDAASVPPEPIGTNPFHFRSGKVEFEFSPETGQLLRATKGEGRIPLANGPRLIAERADKAPLPLLPPAVILTAVEGGNRVIEARHAAGMDYFKWTVKPDGELHLDYRTMVPAGAYQYAGIGFNLEDRAVLSKRWLGGGPYRVWKNRMPGPTFGVWENVWNDGVAGESWELPEFKGIFKDVKWMRLDFGTAAVTAGVIEGSGLVGALRPRNGRSPMKSTFAYPAEDGLYFFDAIPAIGNKFHAAALVGPQSQPAKMAEPIAGSVRFRFE